VDSKARHELISRRETRDKCLQQGEVRSNPPGPLRVAGNVGSCLRRFAHNRIEAKNLAGSEQPDNKECVVQALKRPLLARVSLKVNGT
jgi:hypothetical protein